MKNIRQKRIRATIFLFVALLISGCRGISPPSGINHIERILITTGYCKCGKCCGWRRTWYGRPVHLYGSKKGKRKRIGLTASGTFARKGTIAADTSRYPFGTIMYIDGYGYGRVEDKGGAIRGDRIDLFFPTHKQALKWGKKKIRVKIWISSNKSNTLHH